MSHDAVVVAFARLPLPGKAKTRLAAGVGPTAAAEFYKLCAECTFHQIAGCPNADARVYCSLPDDIPEIQQWLQQIGVPMPVHSQQQTPDLGQRMVAALTAAATKQEPPEQHHDQQLQQQWKQRDQQQQITAEDLAQQVVAAPAAAATQPQGSYVQQLQQHDQQQQQPPDLSQQQEQQAARQLNGWQAAQLHPNSHHRHRQQQQQKPYTAAIVVGTDIPELGATVVATAVTALHQYDMVLGPAKDGGFYLMGFRIDSLLKAEVQSCGIFEGVVWSAGTVLRRTMQGAVAAGLSVAPLDTLPVLQDVDNVEDLKKWVEHSIKQNLQQGQTLEGAEQQQQQQQPQQNPELVQPQQQQQQQQLGVQVSPKAKLLEYCQHLLTAQ